MALKPINQADPVVTFNTSSGSFVVELFSTQAPVTTANFLKYVNSNFYSNTLFHRVIDNFVVQGGGYTQTGPTTISIKPTDAPIPLESQTGLSNTRGTIAMARTDVPDSATSQFYFNLVDNTGLNYQNASSPGYAVFGTVIAGMNVVDAISKAPVTSIANSGLTSFPYPFVTINSVKHTRLDTDGVAGQAYRIYKAAFDRNPDTGILGFWLEKMDKGMDVVQVAEDLIRSDEFRLKYNNSISNADFLTKVYSNVLDRNPDQAGLAWWVSEMSTNPTKTWQKVLADFSESAENQANVASLIANGIPFDPWVG